MAYIYAISDIHGRYDLLKNVVDEWVRFENGDQLILVGDYIDGDCHGNSCLTLQYIYQLQIAYPQQVIVLQGNHEEWLLSFLEDRETYLDTQIDMSFSTLESFTGEEEMTSIYQRASAYHQDRFSIIEDMYHQCRELICQKHASVMNWLKHLPYYYENDHQIFVHAGIEVIDYQPELWKQVSTVNTYLMKCPASQGQFYKKVIAGHIGTHQVTHQSDFHQICCLGDFIYLDSSVITTQFLNVLQYDCQTCRYQGLIKKNQQWQTYDIAHFNK